MIPNWYQVLLKEHLFTYYDDSKIFINILKENGYLYDSKLIPNFVKGALFILMVQMPYKV